MKDLIAKLHSNAADQILATFSTLEMQLQGFAKSSYEKDLRIAELEAQIAGESASADTDKLRETWAKDAEEFGDHLNTACWAFMEAAPNGSITADLWNNSKKPIRAAILKYVELVSSTALQAPVREVPDNTHKLITSTSLIDLRGDLAVAAALGESITLSPESMKAILHAMRTGYPLPAAPVQQEGE